MPRLHKSHQQTKKPRYLGPCVIWDIRPKRILDPNLAKSRLPITYFADARSFWNFAQTTTEVLSWSVQNFKTIGQLKQVLWTNEISRDICLIWVSDGHPTWTAFPVQGWGLLGRFPPFLDFPNVSTTLNRRYLLNITLIFDRCCRSSAAVTPVKYECDLKNVTGTYARSKILLTEKLTNGALVTPTPDVPVSFVPQ